MSRRQGIKPFCYDCLIRLAFEGLSTAIVLTDTRCRLIFANRAAHKVFGISPSDVGSPIQQVLSDISLLAFWSEAQQGDEPVMGLVKVTYPEERLLRATVGICRTKRGTLIGRALLACDVTEDRKVALEVSEELARILLSRKAPTFSEQRLNLDALTPMEWRILRLLGKGLSNNEIASELIVSLNTLRTHLKSIYRKLNLPNRNAAVVFAAQLHQSLPQLTLTLLGE